MDVLKHPGRKKPLERIAETECNQKVLLELMSLYLAHTKANSTAIAALLESFADMPHVRERLEWHLNAASESALKDVPNLTYLHSLEHVATLFKSAVSKDLKDTERIRAH